MNRSLICLLACAGLSAQVAEKANKGYVTPEGRSNIARTLSAADRAERLQAAEMVKTLGVKPGTTVADIGTGTGVLLPFLSAAVGPGGRVVAQDIFRDFLDRAKAKAQSEKLDNIMYVEGTDRNPNLPEHCCDLALTVDAYHHFDFPERTLAGVRRSLRPGGRLAIVDYYRRPGAMEGNQALEHIRLDLDDVVKEVEANGFRLLERREHVPGKQYLIVFTMR
jgi:ubiquinone/menaquinone biosynthesis C-methylase UbiE